MESKNEKLWQQWMLENIGGGGSITRNYVAQWIVNGCDSVSTITVSNTWRDESFYWFLKEEKYFGVVCS